MKLRKAPIIFIFFLLLAWHCKPAIAEISKSFHYDSRGRRDPFLPWDGSEAKNKSDMDTHDLHVEGIIFDQAKGSLVVINGTVLKEGDSVGQYKISKIEKERVLITKEDEEVWLPFKTGENGA